EASARQQADADQLNTVLVTLVAAQRLKRAALIDLLAGRLFEERLAALPAVLRDDIRQALKTTPARRNEVQKYLAAKFQAALSPAGPALEQALARRYPGEYAGARKIDDAIAALLKKRVVFPEIRALYDLPGSVPTRLLRRGDYLNPGAEVEPGAL